MSPCAFTRASKSASACISSRLGAFDARVAAPADLGVRSLVRLAPRTDSSVGVERSGAVGAFAPPHAPATKRRAKDREREPKRWDIYTLGCQPAVGPPSL